MRLSKMFSNTNAGGMTQSNIGLNHIDVHAVNYWKMVRGDKEDQRFLIIF